MARRLAAEHGNLRAALGWATERGKAETALRLFDALLRFWIMRGHLGEGRRWGERALALPGDVPTDLRIRVLVSLGELTARHADPEAARPLAEEGLALARARGDDAQELRATNVLGMVAAEAGDLGEARARLEQMLALARALGDRRREATALNNLGYVASESGDQGRAEALYEEALAIARAVGDGEAVGLLANLGHVLGLQCRTAGGGAAAGGARLPAQSRAGGELGRRTRRCGGPGRASRPADAARLFGAVAALRAATDVPLSRAYRGDEERSVARVRAALDETAYAMPERPGPASRQRRPRRGRRAAGGPAEEPEPPMPSEPTAPGRAVAART